MRWKKPLAMLLAAAAPFVIVPAASANGSHSGPSASHDSSGPHGHQGRPSKLFPDDIALPNAFGPEGITIRGTSLYAGSLVDGDIYKASLITGRGAILIDAPAGRRAVGITTDAKNRLFVAGGQTGAAYVYDLRNGATLATYQVPSTAPAAFINDVALTPHAAYFTDSFNPVLYRIPLGKRGALPPSGPLEALTLTGPAADDVAAGQFNLNGIVYSESAKALIAVNSFRGTLYRIDPQTGASALIDLGGQNVINGDGLVLDGRTLYVVQNQNNQIGVVKLSKDLARGVVGDPITDPRFRVPTTAAKFGPFLYAVNARFDVVTPGGPIDPGVDFNVIRVLARPHSHK